MNEPLPVIVQGLGPIGIRIVEAALTAPFLKVVGAVEINPEMVGKRLSDIVDGAPDVTVRDSVEAAREGVDSDNAVLVHCTGSYLDRVAGQIEEALRVGLHVVSTCEELTFPVERHPEIAARLDAMAREARRTVVATGVNPGFLMDALPASLSSISHNIQSVSVRRVQDPSRRRVPF